MIPGWVFPQWNPLLTSIRVIREQEGSLVSDDLEIQNRTGAIRFGNIWIAYLGRPEA